MRTVAIYPEAWADSCKANSGQKYRPSNADEGEVFFDAWCRHCQHDRAMREDAPLEDCDDDERCDIIADTFSYAVDDPKYPAAWQYGPDGQPRCTAFAEPGNLIHRDELTLDLFATTPAQAATDKSEDSTPLVKCAAARDGGCSHKQCPQLRDNEPRASGRHCPIDTDKSED